MSIVDEGIFDVKSKELQALEDELFTAAANFGKSFDELDSRLSSLTSSGFTGEAADALIQLFNSRVKPKLLEVKKQTDQAAGFMDDKAKGFAALSSKMEDIARG